MFTIQSPGFEKATTRLDVFTTRPNPPLNVQLARATTAVAPGPLAGIDAKGIQRQIDGAESLAASGEYAAAIAAYRALLAQVPALTSIHLQIGALHERLRDTPAALDAYRRLAALEPDNAAARAAIERLSGR